MFLFSLFHLPGTILHELAHFLIGLILLAQPIGFSLFPKRVGSSIVMGSVSFARLFILTRVFVGMAPILLLPIGLYLSNYFASILIPMPFNVMNALKATFFGYILYTIFISSIPSSTDFKVAFGWLIYPLIIMILILTYIYISLDNSLYKFFF
jgi:hypothetical protein